MDKHVQIIGSERKILPNARRASEANLNDEISVLVIVRRHSKDKDSSAILNDCQFSKIHYTHEMFEKNFFIHPDDLKILEDFADEYGLKINETISSSGIVSLTGSIENLSRAFQVEMADYEHPHFHYRGRNGYVHIPQKLSHIIHAVLGLDNRPQTKAHFRLMQNGDIRMRKNGQPSSFTPLEIAKLYNFPQDIDCSEQCIGIIELGGGYLKDDIDQYFSRLGVPAPEIVDIEVDGAKNSPTGDANGPDGEVALDIEIAAAVAPNAKIAVYFAPNSDAGFLKAITTAIHDKVNKPSVISISWGAPEKSWTKQAMDAMNKAFKDAAALGITILCASGDNGSSDGVDDGTVHVDFPASSPFVIGCGGTRLEGINGSIAREIVWNEVNNGSTGGGFSSYFMSPEWQKNLQNSQEEIQNERRGVPDVAGNADPLTGYKILVGGQEYVFGGTSAVAPLYAGLVANLNQQLGRPIGFITPFFYQMTSSNNSFRDITDGNNDTVGNGSYAATVGWDPCTGLGSIDGLKLLNALSAYFSSNLIVQ
ncbi:S53 family peptidase [Heyndrickxia camelliae]|uniref:Peptidase S53 n=1 Tax=Heyndrickxia camelliae TaxID=1707093 RepID=A0A2N3LKV2_9BACI|nr:S53 family peptidase [Heyndrickxia camelliae]PKR85159.1 peptidase S53 [Heyndrickxia camelliae]